MLLFSLMLFFLHFYVVVSPPKKNVEEGKNSQISHRGKSFKGKTQALRCCGNFQQTISFTCFLVSVFHFWGVEVIAVENNKIMGHTIQSKTGSSFGIVVLVPRTISLVLVAMEQIANVCSNPFFFKLQFDTIEIYFSHVIKIMIFCPISVFKCSPLFIQGCLWCWLF